MRRCKAILTVVVIVAFANGAALAQDTESWSGVVDLSGAGGSELRFTVTFTLGGAPTATISIPAQGATDLPLSAVVYSDERLEFTLMTSPASAEFAADRDGDTAVGTLRQGREFPVRLERLAEGPPVLARPQMPAPPFPYASRDVAYQNPAEGNTLAGTLTVPEGPGPHPAALLITGSGSQDRDETIFGHKPFWVLADHLTRNGIAVLRVDDRGMGGSDGARVDITSADFAGDVSAGVGYLGEQPEIDASRIGLIGHSEGGFIAPMVAAESDGIAFVVLLAGTGVPGSEIMPVQNELLLRAAGLDERAIERNLEAYAGAIDAILSGADDEALREALGRLVDVQLESAPADNRQALRDNAVETATAQLGSPWFRYFLATDPADFLERVRCPVLALNGTLDLQVSHEQNLPAIAAALEHGGNTDVTTREMDGLNHLFQTATTGAVGEYGAIEETFAPAALELVASWVRSRTGLE